MRNEEVKQRREAQIYPNYAHDPDPLPDTSPNTKQTAHQETLREYYHDIYVNYKRTHLKGEALWKTSSQHLSLILCEVGCEPKLLRGRVYSRAEVFSSMMIGQGTVECLIGLLYRTEYIH